MDSVMMNEQGGFRSARGCICGPNLCSEVGN